MTAFLPDAPTFQRRRGLPLQILLTLREDGVWLPDTLPGSKRVSKVKGHKGAKRYGKAGSR
ncbi:MAG: hypothetical protein ACR5LG_16040 [Sodalis sp. (in: enterobacteria)]|uniref:hypothetical protein n=1 Tax=Sodalis sp. (in: enterobacteria) TaxID=1898979 RepID=UPI003F3B2FAC